LVEESLKDKKVLEGIVFKRILTYSLKSLKMNLEIVKVREQTAKIAKE